MKKLISILLSVAMFLTVFVAAIPASASEEILGNDVEEKKASVSANHVPADFDGDGKTDAGAVAINSVAGLQGISGGGKYYLTSDIVVKTGENGVTAGKPVKGWSGGFYLDGCGYTVKMNENAGTAATSTSLFDGSAETIYVKNLNVTGIINAPASHNQHISALGQGGGGIVAENVVSDVDITVESLNGNLAVGGVWSKTEASKPATFKKVHFTGSITMKCPVPTAGYGGVGGIVGYSKCALTVEDCSNTGNITVGYAGMTVPTGEANFGVGGIVGKLDNNNNGNKAKIVRSSNSGNIEVIALNNSYIGGMVGYSYRTDLYIDMCENSGAFKTANNTTTAGSGNIHTGMGGMLGGAYNDNTTCKIEIYGCKNTASGKMTTQNETVQNVYAGGMVGRLYAVADVRIVDCSNAADIDVSKGVTWASAGGIVGTYMTMGSELGWSKISDSTLIINKCQNSGKMTAGVWAAGILASGIQLLEDNINIKISYCLNAASGEIKAGMDSTVAGADRAAAGGIAGMLGWEHTYANWELFGNADFEYCVNKAPITVGDKGRAAGGILGETLGDSLNGNVSGGTDSKEASQKTWYGKTCDSYTQRTWFDWCGSDGAITCQNASGKAACIAGAVANKYYLWNSQALGSRTVGTAAATTNAWVTATWVEQAGNDMNSGKMATLVSSVTDVLTKASELTAAIKSVESLGKTGLQTQLDAAYAARLTNDTAAMAAALTALEEIENVDTTKLEAAIADAEALNESDYTPDSWAILQLVLADAKIAVNATSQQTVDAAESALRDAMAALENNSGNGGNGGGNGGIDGGNGGNDGDDNEVTVDYSKLEAAIESAEVLDSNDYTSESWEAVADALAAAKAALSAQTQSEVDVAEATLKAAVAALEEPDYSALEAVIAEAEEQDESEYSADAWEALLDALDTAKFILENSRMQVEIDDATMALSDAIDAKSENGNDDLGGGDSENDDNLDDGTSNDGSDDGDGETESGDNNGSNAGEKEDGESNNTDNANGESESGDNTDDKNDESNGSRKAEKKGGCGSAIAASAVVLTTVLALGVGFKKKED
ncbi:MAG: hypothetical protein E7677_05460 [Ruminococcaceae bacterium]|nr:hypothetical protein [Oscillospiraceae bacterium]